MNTDWATLGIIFTIVSAVSSLTWWLSGQFSSVRNLVFTRVEMTAKAILDKLEYHERHDDERFSEIREGLSEVRVRNASKDVLMSSIISRLDKIQNHG